MGLEGAECELDSEDRPAERECVWTSWDERLALGLEVYRSKQHMHLCSEALASSSEIHRNSTEWSKED